MVVDDMVEYCSGKTHNFEISHDIHYEAVIKLARLKQKTNN